MTALQDKDLKDEENEKLRRQIKTKNLRILELKQRCAEYKTKIEYDI
jgi:hypothetical protein